MTGLFDGMMKATTGDTHLGGEDFDDRVVDYCTQDLKRTQFERAKLTPLIFTQATFEIDAAFLDGMVKTYAGDTILAARISITAALTVACMLQANAVCER